jgi:Amt family ammonium transporter
MEADAADAIAAGITGASDLAKLAWLLVSAGLVLFMQAGFAAVETGSVRYKNSINVALKNIIDLCVSSAAFFVVGYSLMFGASIQVGGWGIIGTPTLFLTNIETATIAISTTTMAFFLFQMTFCNTAATIVSGGVAERCRFMAYVLVTLGVALVIYPLFGHWVWGGGWLAQLKYHDFAGSSVVHMIGAGVALAGIHVLGSRLGRFDAQGKAHRIPASSLPLVSIGVVILAFGWIGFNGGSAPLGTQTATIITNTLIAACFGGLAAMLLVWATGGLAEADLILNGVLGGLVAITAGADCVTPTASALIGIIGGVAVVIGCRMMERWRLDDAVGAVPVHGFAGFAGVVVTGVFCESRYLADWDISRGNLILVQIIGATTAAVWSYVLGLVLWTIVGRISSLRIGPAEEEVGMNYSEHKVDDPMLDLTNAVVAAVAGKDKGLAVLDNVREGDLVALARAVKVLVNRHAGAKRNAESWAQAIEGLKHTLLEQQHMGSATAATSLDELKATRETLDHVLTFLRDHHAEASSSAMLTDLIRLVQGRIDALTAALPRIIKSFDTVRHTSGQLDQLAGNIRGGRA